MTLTQSFSFIVLSSTREDPEISITQMTVKPTSLPHIYRQLHWCIFMKKNVVLYNEIFLTFMNIYKPLSLKSNILITECSITSIGQCVYFAVRINRDGASEVKPSRTMLHLLQIRNNKLVVLTWTLPNTILTNIIVEIFHPMDNDPVSAPVE